MRPASLIITVDRGSLRAYRVEETATRGVHLELVRGFDIPNMGNSARTDHTVLPNDSPQLKNEEDRRICKQLANEIAGIVADSYGEGWGLAAPEAIHSEIVDLLPTEIRERIVEHVQADLVKIPADELPERFRSLQEI